MPAATTPNPPPLTAAASLVVLEGLALVVVALFELGDVAPERLALGVGLSTFFVVYGVVLVGAAWALVRQQGWARGPVLLTQLIQLGLAWNLRDYQLVALTLAVAAGLVLAGVLHPASVKVLADDPMGE